MFRKLVWRQPLDAAYVSGCLDVAIAGLSPDVGTVARLAPR